MKARSNRFLHHVPSKPLSEGSSKLTSLAQTLTKLPEYIPSEPILCNLTGRAQSSFDLGSGRQFGYLPSEPPLEGLSALEPSWPRFRRFLGYVPSEPPFEGLSVLEFSWPRFGRFLVYVPSEPTFEGSTVLGFLGLGNCFFTWLGPRFVLELFRFVNLPPPEVMLVSK